MREAIRVAGENGFDPSLSPIGCGIVRNGKIWAARRNKVAQLHDPVAHAEIEAICAAGAAFENGELREATLYDRTAVRHVHDGIHMIEGKQNCLWCWTRRRSRNVF
jgi:hypothetical protein